jgi:AbrB family looped-hinge helix DNA binding protein
MTQFVRRVDKMSRIVIPAEYRKNTGINEMTEVRITECDGKIIIEKLAPECKICGAKENVNEEFGVCKDCIDKIKAL